MGVRVLRTVVSEGVVYAQERRVFASEVYKSEWVAYQHGYALYLGECIVCV